jgi:hypothetical protein
MLELSQRAVSPASGLALSGSADVVGLLRIRDRTDAGNAQLRLSPDELPPPSP